MITLLASIAGFVTAAIPEFFKIFADRHRKSHELAILDREIEIQEKGLSRRLDQIGQNADISEIKALYSTYKSGIGWADALNASVRPVLAYSFFGLYAAVKLLQYQILINSDAQHLVAELLWTIEDQAIFAGIISFYFGQRAITKRMKDR